MSEVGMRLADVENLADSVEDQVADLEDQLADHVSLLGELESGVDDASAAASTAGSETLALAAGSETFKLRSTALGFISAEPAALIV